jgi:hypothetical protein
LFELTLANEINLADFRNEDFEQVLHRPTETAPFIWRQVEIQVHGAFRRLNLQATPADVVFPQSWEF